MKRPNLDAIEYDDHMLIIRIEDYSVALWYPTTITQLVAYARHLEKQNESLKETVAVLSDPDAMSAITKADSERHKR